MNGKTDLLACKLIILA